MPASQTRSVGYRIGEAASGGSMGVISQPANQSESGVKKGRKQARQGRVAVYAQLSANGRSSMSSRRFVR